MIEPGPKLVTGLREPDRHRPLRPYLMVLTIVTGIVDAVSYLKLNHVFVANMTGNVVFLGFAAVDPVTFSVWSSLAAVVAFLVGALAGGRLASGMASHRGRLLAVAICMEFSLVAAALAVSVIAPAPSLGRYLLIILLALAMGIQNATARRLAVPDLTTTVLTLVLTGVAADSRLAGGGGSHLRLRATAAVMMFCGAAAGAKLVTGWSISATLVVVLLLLGVVGASMGRKWSSTEQWTVGT